MFGDLRHAGDFLTRNARRMGKEFALAYADRRITWSELNSRANRFAHALHSLGLRQGEAIALYARNSNQFVEALFGAAKIGIGVATVNYRLVSREVEYIVRDSGSAAIVFDPEDEAVVEAIRPCCPRLRHFICTGHSGQGHREYEPMLAGAAASEPQPERPIQDEDPLLLIYTSGTTGLPKGAVWWHKGTILNIHTFAHAIGIRHGMKLVLPAPLYATAGAGMILASVCVGASSRVVNFEPHRVLATLAEEKVDYINLVPATINFLLNLPEFREYDLSHLKTILYAGSVMPVPLLRRALQEFHCEFRQVFGMTETCCVGTVLEPWEHVLEGDPRRVRRLASCGRAQVNVEVRVVNDQGEDVAPETETGEIIVKSDGNIKAYHNLPEATSETVRDGWVYTGDCGFMDEDGYIFIVDRKKDMIVSGALNVYPAEIENVLYGHPGILECAVIGVPNATWGEAVKAVVVPRPGARLTEEEIIEFCRGRLADFKRPRSVDFVESLPRNMAGKVLKRLLREPYWQGAERKV